MLQLNLIIESNFSNLKYLLQSQTYFKCANQPKSIWNSKMNEIYLWYFIRAAEIL